MLSCSVVSDFLQPHGLWPARLLCPWDFPRKNTAAGCHVLLQRIFLTLIEASSPSLAGGFFTTSATWGISTMYSGRVYSSIVSQRVTRTSLSTLHALIFSYLIFIIPLLFLSPISIKKLGKDKLRHNMDSSTHLTH